MTNRRLHSKIYLVHRNGEQDIKCDSGVVGNARPCQGRDRGFEPRLSLRKTLDFQGFFILAKTSFLLISNTLSIIEMYFVLRLYDFVHSHERHTPLYQSDHVLHHIQL